MSERQLIPFSETGLDSASLSEADQAVLELRLWQLLARRTELFTMHESSSVRVETAQELFASICFLLRLFLQESGRTLQSVIEDDMDAVLDAAIALVEQKFARGKSLFRAVCLGAAGIDSLALTDTLRGLGSFFKQYDCRYFAHQTPCDIDYPLCRPVPVAMCGIEYINEYLSRLLLENHFVLHFPKECIHSLLGVINHHDWGLPINLYEPVLANALGLALLHCDVDSLCISPAQQHELVDLMGVLPREKLRTLLCQGVQGLSRLLDVRHVAAQDYMRKAAVGLMPRIQSALASQHLNGIFLTWQ